MIAIPAGTYRIGSSLGRQDETPEHFVSVSAFEIDAFPVTVAEVHEVSREYGLPLPVAWSPSPPVASGLPATTLTLAEACRLAQRMGKRLPTEEEFELAAGRAFGRDTHVHDRPSAGPLPLMTAPQALRSGLVTSEGLIAMVGIVWHWTASSYNWYAREGTDARVPLPTIWTAVRGGIWSAYDARASFRSFRDPIRGYSRVAFRCVRDLKAR